MSDISRLHEEAYLWLGSYKRRVSFAVNLGGLSRLTLAMPIGEADSTVEGAIVELRRRM